MEVDEDSPAASQGELGTKTDKAKGVLSTLLLLLIVLSGSDTVVLGTMEGWQNPSLVPSSVRRHPLPSLPDLASSCNSGVVAWLDGM